MCDEPNVFGEKIIITVLLLVFNHDVYAARQKLFYL